MVPHPNSIGITFAVYAQGIWSRPVLERARKVQADVLFLMPTGAVSVQSFSDGHICRGEKAAILSMVRDGQFDFFRGEVDTPGLLNLVKDFCFEGTKQHVQLMGLENFCECENGLFFITVERRGGSFPALIQETAISSFVKA